MSESNRARAIRRKRNQRLGLCRNASSHGPAVRQSMCEACAQAHQRNMTASYHARRERGLCANAPAHGAATCGSLCASCRRKRTAEKRRKRNPPTCAFGAAHGRATVGVWCAACADRRAAAAARVAARSVPQPEPPPPKAPRPRKETVLERVKRGGNIDTAHLWEYYWQRQ